MFTYMQSYRSILTLILTSLFVFVAVISGGCITIPYSTIEEALDLPATVEALDVRVRALETPSPTNITVTATPKAPTGGIALTYEFANDSSIYQETYEILQTDDENEGRAYIFKDYATFLSNWSGLSENYTVEFVAVDEESSGRFDLYSRRAVRDDVAPTIWSEYTDIAALVGEDQNTSPVDDVSRTVFQRPISIAREFQLPAVEGPSPPTTLLTLLDFYVSKDVPLIHSRRILISKATENGTEFILIIFNPESSGARCDLINQYCGDCQTYCWVCGVLTIGCG